MTMTNFDNGSDALEHIRAEVFRDSNELLTREAINDTFTCMDTEIWGALSYLLDSPSKFAEVRLSEVALRLMGNMTYNRVLYNKDKFTPEEWMALGGELLHFTTNRKTLANVANMKTLLKDMAWVRALFEELIEGFLAVTEGYTDLCVQEARLVCTPQAAFGTKLGVLRMQKADIEAKTGLDGERLYGVVKGVQHHQENYMELRNTIVIPYLRLVFAEANKLAGPSREIFVDVFQAGVFGLTRAISTFFPEREAYFSAYARWWVRQAILLSLKEEVSFFKIPSAVWHVFNKMERGEKVEENSEKIRQYVNVIKLVPIDQPIQQDGSTARLVDTIVDTDAEGRANDHELNVAVGSMLEGLDKTTERIICLKFGVISHLHQRSQLSDTEVLHEKLRQTLALMRFHEPSCLKGEGRNETTATPHKTKNGK